MTRPEWANVILEAYQQAPSTERLEIRITEAISDAMGFHDATVDDAVDSVMHVLGVGTDA